MVVPYHILTFHRPSEGTLGEWKNRGLSSVRCSGDSSVGRRWLERCKIERNPIGDKLTLELCRSDNCECVKSGKQHPARPLQPPLWSALPLCRHRRRPCSTTFAVRCNIFSYKTSPGGVFWSGHFPLTAIISHRIVQRVGQLPFGTRARTRKHESGNVCHVPALLELRHG